MRLTRKPTTEVDYKFYDSAWWTFDLDGQQQETGEEQMDMRMGSLNYSG